MCEPVSIGIGIATLAGAAIKAYGEHQEGKAAESQAKANAHLVDVEAADAARQGARRVAQVRGEGTRLLSEQRVGIAASGVELGDGTALRIQSDTAMLTELDALTEENNVAREQWGYRAKASQIRRGGAQAAGAGEMGAFTTILGGAVNAGAGMARTWKPSTGQRVSLQRDEFGDGLKSSNPYLR